MNYYTDICDDRNEGEDVQKKYEELYIKVKRGRISNYFLSVNEYIIQNKVNKK